MSITIRKRSLTEKRMTVREWQDDLDHESVMLESLGVIIIVQAHDSYCCVSLYDEITFTIYDTFSSLVSDLGISSSMEAVILNEIDIYYDVLKE